MGNYTTGPRVSKIDVLGITYDIKVCPRDEDPYLNDNPGCGGYCDTDAKVIVLPDFTDDRYYKRQHLTPKAIDNRWKVGMRHELVHAFLAESGLDDNALTWNHSWTNNEEMSDWIAIMGPRLIKAWQKCGCLDEEPATKRRK